MVHDTTVITAPDLGTNFYAREADIGKKTRAETCLPELQALNQYVEVSSYTGEITTEYLAQFDVVVLTEFYDKAKLLEINEFCRTQEKAKGFIWSGSLGLYGWTFVDFGPNHTVFDHNGERCLSAIVTSISQAEEGVVTVTDEKRHGFEDGDWIQFKEVEGMEEINDQKFQIKVISPYSFSIGDTRNFGAYSRQGIAQQVKVPQSVKFYSLSEALADPMTPGTTELHDPDMDFMNLNKPFALHLILKSVLEFHASQKRLPELLNEEDVKILSGVVNHKLEEVKGKKKAFEEKWATKEGEEAPEDKPKEPSLFRLEDVPEELIRNVSRFARAQVAPFNSFWGGIVAQEIVKYTGKFSPLRQWLHYSCFNLCLPADDVKRTIQEDSRYRDQTVIFGDDAMEKLANLKIFMIGAGALGCEYLKQFGLMGVASKGEGHLTVTDDDTIEISNLNRQFLFRRHHVGESKAEISCGVAKTINPALKVTAHKGRAAPNTENVFTDVFWDGLDCVFGAVDNIHARQYIDSKCVLHKKNLFESGTLGTKCNSQMVVPYKTQSYGDSQDPKEASIPMCTLRNYPYLLDHTIEWARDYFQGFCVNGSADFGALVKDPAGYVKQCQDEQANQAGSILEKFRFLSRFLICWPEVNTQSLVNVARQLFQDIFHDQIAQLLYCFPVDYKNDDGQLFWSSPKRPPYIIEFDAADEMHFLFVKAVVVILGEVFGVKVGETDEQIRELAKNAPFTVTQPGNKKIKTSDDDNVQEGGDADDAELEELVRI